MNVPDAIVLYLAKFLTTIRTVLLLPLIVPVKTDEFETPSFAKSPHPQYLRGCSVITSVATSMSATARTENSCQRQSASTNLF